MLVQLHDILMIMSGFIWSGKSREKYQTLGRPGKVRESQGICFWKAERSGKVTNVLKFSATSAYKLYFSRHINIPTKIDVLITL